MSKIGSDALGIIFPNSYDSQVPELVNERLMASIPFAARYRMIDFILSSMVNSGIDNVAVITKKNYNSLMDHLGSGREWDLTRKNGGLLIIPPFSERSINVYGGKIEALSSFVGFLKKQKEKYVVFSDANMAVNFDFNDFINKHIQSGADVTAAYVDMPIPDGFLNANVAHREMYYTFDICNDRIEGIRINNKEAGVQHFGMNIYCMERERIIVEAEMAFAKGYKYFERDYLIPLLNIINVVAYKYEGYVACISDMKGYFDENMKLLDEDNVERLFDPSPIYTKVRDDNPTRYIKGAKASNVMVADGCVIEGEVENSILFRGVHIHKGAKVSNCILMQDTIVGEGSAIDRIITDKNVVVSKNSCITGSERFPVYISKRKTV